MCALLICLSIGLWDLLSDGSLCDGLLHLLVLAADIGGFIVGRLCDT